MENKNLDSTKRTERTDKKPETTPGKRTDKVEFAADYDGETKRTTK